MAIHSPPYILDAEVDSTTLRFHWDDWTSNQEYAFDSAWVAERMAHAALRARVALGIGVYEWIVWRFQRLSPDPTPLQVAEAAWCAVVDRRYMAYTELDRAEWLGPVRGPLWFAMTWVFPLIFAGDDNLEECESGLIYLPKMAARVLPDLEPFEGWLSRCVERLSYHFPNTDLDPFEDLFGEHEEERRGPLVPRQALEPGFPIGAVDPKPLISAYLANVDRSNPFLRSPADMLQDGFSGTPYALP